MDELRETIACLIRRIDDLESQKRLLIALCRGCLRHESSVVDLKDVNALLDRLAKH